jgi:hypothetical protein
MKNEVLCKFLCHNICVVYQSHIELGIEPVFWPAQQPVALPVVQQPCGSPTSPRLYSAKPQSPASNQQAHETTALGLVDGGSGDYHPRGPGLAGRGRWLFQHNREPECRSPLIAVVVEPLSRQFSYQPASAPITSAQG